jgi:hypothetical protein
MRSSSIGAGLVGLGLLATAGDLNANEPTPVVVTMGGSAELRVQITAGLTVPCDSDTNRPVFDGRMKPGDTLSTTIAGECICVRHTTAAFRETGWTTPALLCRRRICRGRTCKPAPDPTIRLSLP